MAPGCHGGGLGRSPELISAVQGIGTGTCSAGTPAATRAAAALPQCGVEAQPGCSNKGPATPRIVQTKLNPHACSVPSPRTLLAMTTRRSLAIPPTEVKSFQSLVKSSTLNPFGLLLVIEPPADCVVGDLFANKEGVVGIRGCAPTAAARFWAVDSTDIARQGECHQWPGFVRSFWCPR